MHTTSRIRALVSTLILGGGIGALSLFAGGASHVMAQDDTATGQYASVNGIELYYEVYGTGEPIILLHGGLGTIDLMFGQMIPALAETRQVIAVELQGHGHTALGDRPLSFEAMADDVGALITHLELEQTDVLGFSLGGGVALQTAIRHPEQVRKLVLISTAFRRDGWYPEVLAGMSAMNADAAAMMLETPLYQVYASAAPRPEDWSALVSGLGVLLAQDYDWTAQVEALETPALVVIGDADSIRPAHAVELFSLFGGGLADGGMGGVPASQFAVLPGTTHIGIMSRTDLLLPIITPFLDAETPAAS